MCAEPVAVLIYEGGHAAAHTSGIQLICCGMHVTRKAASGRFDVVCSSVTDHRCYGMRRDTYPNQHVEISVRVYIYRWISTDLSGIPQVGLLAAYLAGFVAFNVLSSSARVGLKRRGHSCLYSAPSTSQPYVLLAWLL